MGKEFFVIILDGDINPATWDFVAKRDALPDIMEVTEYSVFNRESRSKSEYEGVSCNTSKNIINTQTQSNAHGEVYKLTRR